MGLALTSAEGFAELVREQQAMVFRTLTRLTGGGAHVEDLAQEAFLRLYKALPEFRGDAAVATYLYRIVVNLAQDEWKRRRRERAHVAVAPVFDEEDQSSWLENFAGETEPDGGAGQRRHLRSPEQVMLDAGEERLLDQEWSRLPEIERAVLVLYYQEECSYVGIAAALELPINTVRTHLHRGRKRLAAAVQQRLRDVPVKSGGPEKVVAGLAATARSKTNDRLRWEEERV